jgi:membrane protease YdiL (CAAX protease family)
MNARRSVALELLAIGVVAAIFVATFRARPQYVNFALAVIAAVVLMAASARRSRKFWDAAPLVPGGGASRRAWLESGSFTGVALLVLVALAVRTAGGGAALAARAANWHLAAALPLYFAWGLVQQYLFQRFLLARLLQLLPPAAAIALTAIAFSSVHFPRWPVMALVLIACSVWSTIYYRTRALLPLAASHALLASVLHYWVFGNDLLQLWLNDSAGWFSMLARP